MISLLLNDKSSSSSLSLLSEDLRSRMISLIQRFHKIHRAKNVNRVGSEAVNVEQKLVFALGK